MDGEIISSLLLPGAEVSSAVSKGGMETFVVSVGVAVAPKAGDALIDLLREDLAVNLGSTEISLPVSGSKI